MFIKKKLIKSEENLNLLANKLNSLCTFLHEVYKINAGGCCYIAGILTKLLEIDEIDYSVIVYGCEYDDFYCIPCSQYHYAVRINETIVNCYEDDENYSEFYNICSKDLLEHYKECDWNDSYDKNQNKYIYKVIKNFYNDFTDDLRKR